MSFTFVVSLGEAQQVIFLLWLSDNTLCVYQNQYSVELLKGNNGILNGIFNKRREIPCCLPRQYVYISKAHDGKNKGSPHISQEFTPRQLLGGSWIHNLYKPMKLLREEKSYFYKGFMILCTHSTYNNFMARIKVSKHFDFLYFL